MNLKGINKDGRSIVVFSLLEYLLYPVFKLLWLVWYMPMVLIGMCKSKRVCPPMNNPPQCMMIPAHELVLQIAKRKVTSRFVLESYIARIKEVNPVVNAIVEERFETALKEADAIDKKICTTSNGGNDLIAQFPLLGIPLTIKESIGVQGMSNAAGCYNAAGRRAVKDAEIVEKCKKLGAIILAVTNTPELCMNWETYNKLTGCTNNPHDSRKTCGGSSGGEAALLGAGASLIGLGSDVGGSLRLPAHYCGIFAHKPTANVVSTIGHYPDCKNIEKWNKHFNLGPMARYATDLLPMMRILVKDEFAPAMKLDREIDITDVKVFYLKHYGSVLNACLDSEISNAFDFVLDHFKIKHDLNVQPLKKNFFAKTIIPFINTLLEINGVDDYFYDKPRSNTFIEFLKIMFHCSTVSLTCVVYKLFRKCAKNFPASTFKNTNKKIDTIRGELEAILGDDGVLLMPSFHRTANYHYTTIPKAFDTINAIAFNVMGLPASNCPIGWHSDGLPFGIQVISKRYNDRLSIAVAEEIEMICGGWRFPQTT